jgi:hypothetical protein
VADHFYYLTLPSTVAKGAVTKAASTGSTNFELRIADGGGLTRLDLLRGLDQLRAYITEDGQPA